MDKLAQGLIGLVALGAIASPVKALTEAELAIGLQLVSCLSRNGCYYQPYHPSPYYNNHNYYYSNPPYYYSQPNSFPYSHPHVIIVPTRPQYRYTPPYSGYYFDRDRYQFRQKPSYFHGYRQDVRGQINQIYRYVLRRDADIDGLNTYQDRYNNGWSLADIERDIVNSEEARNLHRY